MADCFPINFMKIADDDIITKFLNIKSLGDKLEWYSGNSEYSHGGFAKKGLGYVLPKIENVDFKVLKQDESNLNKASESIDSVNIKWENNKLVWNFNNQNILELEICDETLKSQLIKEKKDIVTDEEKKEKDAVTNAIRELDSPEPKEPKKEPIKESEIVKMEEESAKVAELDKDKKDIDKKLASIEEKIADKNKKLEEAAKAKLFGTEDKKEDDRGKELEVAANVKLFDTEEKKEDDRVKKLEEEAKADLFGTEEKIELAPKKEEAKVEEVPKEEVPKEEAKVEEVPKEEDKVEEAKVEEAKVEEANQKGGRRKYKSKYRRNKRNKRKSRRKKRLLI
jgi:hypothetical protein